MGKRRRSRGHDRKRRRTRSKKTVVVNEVSEVAVANEDDDVFESSSPPQQSKSRKRDRVDGNEKDDDDDGDDDASSMVLKVKKSKIGLSNGTSRRTRSVRLVLSEEDDDEEQENGEDMNGGDGIADGSEDGVVDDEDDDDKEEDDNDVRSQTNARKSRRLTRLNAEPDQAVVDDDEGKGADEVQNGRRYPLRRSRRKSRFVDDEAGVFGNGGGGEEEEEDNEEEEDEESNDSFEDDDDEEEEEEEIEPPRHNRVTRRSTRYKEMMSVADDGEEHDDNSKDGEDAESPHYVRRSTRVRKEVQRFAARLESDEDEDHSRKKKSSRRGSRRRRRRRHFRLQHFDADDSLSSSDSDAEFSRRERHRLDRQLANIRPVNLTDFQLNRVSPGHKKKSTLADTDPVENIDTSVNWESIGGLASHVHSLKEMVMLPLLYPELFERFSITPPRGVLFFGPPGTGKTLVARALANTCSQTGKKVAFFMRKGADCLSKWVGEAERQLRLLFEQAQKLQPSIIFFDEIDGLAPVRSSRQDQIHSSIVSTLLALMDGLDARGQVIVIGATNRVDAIDPALRRPGRFDRELSFPLPTKVARREILAIHTRHWDPPLATEVLNSIADRCGGYCGADMKALCTEASLRAVRRKYPQIYNSSEKLMVDPAAIKLTTQDFEDAMQSITPASHRSSLVHSQELPSHVTGMLDGVLTDAHQRLLTLFPLDATRRSDASNGGGGGGVLPLRPRFLVCGSSGGLGQSYIGPALLHRFEDFPVYSLDLPSLYGDALVRTTEEACYRVFMEARQNAPSIVYWPHVDLWWNCAHEALRTSVMMMIADIPPTSSVLILATSDVSVEALDSDLRNVFAYDPERCVVTMEAPDEDQRSTFVDELVQNVTSLRPRPPPVKPADLPVLPKATIAPVESTFDASLEQLKATRMQEEDALRKLRMFLRGVLTHLIRQFPDFTDSVDANAYPDYYSKILQPVCLSDILKKLNERKYLTIEAVLADIDLLVANTKEFFCADNSVGRMYLNKACHIQDLALSMSCQFDENCAKLCKQIADRRALMPEVDDAEDDAVTTTTKKNQETKNTQQSSPSSSSSSSSSTGSAQGAEETLQQQELPPTPSSPMRLMSQESDDGTSEHKYSFGRKRITKRLAKIRQQLVEATKGFTLVDLEILRSRILRHALHCQNDVDKRELLARIENEVTIL